MTLEKPSQPGAMAGDTFLCLIGDQFARLKWGDRFFYDLSNQAGSFTPGTIFSRLFLIKYDTIRHKSHKHKILFIVSMF